MSDLQSPGYLGRPLTSGWSTWSVSLRNNTISFVNVKITRGTKMGAGESGLCLNVSCTFEACCLCGYQCCYSSRWVSKVKVSIWPQRAVRNVCFLTVFQIALTKWSYQSPSAVVIPQIVLSNYFNLPLSEHGRMCSILCSCFSSKKSNAVARLLKKLLASKTNRYKFIP